MIGSMAISKENLTIKQQKFLLVFKYILALVLICVSSFASINKGNFTPFAFGVYLTLILFKFNVFILSGFYVGSAVLVNFSLPTLYASLNVVAVGILMVIILTKLNKKINKYLLLVLGLVANAVIIYYNSFSSKELLTAMLGVLLGLIFMFACYHFFLATLGKNFNFKLNLDEIIAGSVLLIIFSAGFSAISIYEFELVKVFAVFSILLFTYIFPTFYSIFIAALVGIGGALNTGNINLISSFVSFALFATAFKSNNKLFACLAIILCEVVFGLYFVAYDSFTVFSIVSVLIGQILFLLMPSKVITQINDKLGGVKEKVAIRNIINHSKEGIYKRMNNMADVFSEMNSSFREMVKGVLPVEDAKKVLVSEVIERVSKNSPEITKILRLDSKSTLEVFNSLIDIGFERGKVTLLDVPQYLTSKIGKINYLINTINQLLDSYKHYSVMVSNMDTSRVLIAEQLSGVSDILRSLAQEVKLNITFDLTKENKIMEELSYKNIFCVEAIVYEENAHVLNSMLIIRQQDYNKETIEKVVSKIVKSNMKIMAVTQSSVSGCVVVNLKTQPNYDVVFGSASVGKGGSMISGDTHSIIKIDESKIILALCDGMGSGEHANKTSNLSISLIENFYKAGFNNEIILNSVNKLLSQNNEENFSALDICIIDTRYGISDFIKLGSPEAFIKHKTTTDVVQTSSLPMGILEEMTPQITKKVLTEFDIVVLVSDGITEAFDRTGVSLQTFINNIESTNPQTISDLILEHAMDLYGGISEDDMTVLAVRVYPIN